MAAASATAVALALAMAAGAVSGWRSKASAAPAAGESIAAPAPPAAAPPPPTAAPPALAGAAQSATAADRIAARLRDVLGELVARARPEGGWTFRHDPGTRVAPVSAPLRFAERLAAPLGLATWDVVVVRSPGTPAATIALVEGYRRDPRPEYLATARRAGDLLVATQMPSGGWFSEEPVVGGGPAWWFRAVVRRTAIDDDVTPGAIRALLALWQVTGDARYHDAATRGTELLLAAQLPNGAWPLVWRPAWKRWVWRTFEDLPTLNDGATAQSIVTLLAAWRLLGCTPCLAAARRGGDWIVQVQRPPPDAGWSQQYDEAGRAAPARRYELPALASWESRYALDALRALAAATGDARYCAAIARAARWLRRVRRGECWARFYALDDGRPLFVDEKRRLVESPRAAHQPYDWLGDYGIPYTLDRLRPSAAVGAATGASRGDAASAPAGGNVPWRRFGRLVGDPGECRHGDLLAFDPRAFPDPRTVIAYAGRLLAAVEPEEASPCAIAGSTAPDAVPSGHAGQ